MWKSQGVMDVDSGELMAEDEATGEGRRIRNFPGKVSRKFPLFIYRPRQPYDANANENNKKTKKMITSSATACMYCIQVLLLVCFLLQCLQCFDAVGWAAGRASGL